MGGIVLLVIVMILLPLAARFYITMIIDRHTRVKSFSGMTADQVARRILDCSGLQYVVLERTDGKYTDTYNHKESVIKLSEKVYGKSTISAIGIAAHQCGHAMQYEDGYFGLTLKNIFEPIIRVLSKVWAILIFLGIGVWAYTDSAALIVIGFVIYSLIVVFSLVTLPVEFDACNRVMDVIEIEGLLEIYEVRKLKELMRASAMMSIMKTAVTLTVMIKLFLRIGGNE